MREWCLHLPLTVSCETTERAELRGPSPERDRSRTLRFASATVMSCVVLLLGVFFSSLPYGASAPASGDVDPGIVFFIIGIPSFFVMLVMFAVTIAIALKQNARPLGRWQLVVVFVPMVMTILVPLVATMICVALQK